MCSRYKFTVPLDAYKQLTGVRVNDFALAARFNIAPLQNAPVVVADHGWICKMMRWGFLASKGGAMALIHTHINARAETVAKRTAYMGALHERRCLVLADGYYEWQASRNGRRPYLIRMKDGSPFAFAGLWEPPHPELPLNRLEWTAGMFVIITTEPNTLVSSLRNRMPAIVRPADYEQWLDPSCTDGRTLLPLLKPHPPHRMEYFAVDKYVNEVGHEGPQCVVPV
jgi:putative SOS response-associated peptidase YedK